MTRIPAVSDYYVSTTGSDAADGLTSLTPWLTIQHASDWLLANVDFAGGCCTVHVASGSYAGGCRVLDAFVGGSSAPKLYGPVLFKSDVFGGAVLSGGFGAIGPGRCGVSGFKLGGLYAAQGGFIVVDGPLEFQAAGTNRFHFWANHGGRFLCDQPYTISGGAECHMLSTDGGIMEMFKGQAGDTIDLIGTPHFDVFAYAWDGAGIYDAERVFTGSATGVRFVAQLGACVNTNTGGVNVNYFPGNSAGAAPTGYYN